MALYRYVKTPPKKGLEKQTQRILSGIFLLIGTSLLAWVAYPILAFELTSTTKYASMLSPVPDNYHPYHTAEVDKKEITSNISIKSEKNTKSPSLFTSLAQLFPNNTSSGDIIGAYTSNQSTRTDYTHINSWYPNKPQGNTSTAGQIYFLTIPKLRIKNAIVKIAGEDLNRSLIHYGGTGLPGEYGTAVIFGHSTLPQFYDPDNYKSIFSLLPKLDRKDEIFITYDGITYRYVIFDMQVKEPDDVSVLEQRYDSSFIRLITCVPPGTYWKRLAITAQLQPI